MSDTAPVRTRPTTAQLLARGDMPMPGAHEVIHLTGTDTGCRVTVDTPDGRVDYIVTRENGFYESTRRDSGATKGGGNFGHMLGRILRDARGDD
jgi:hypothetical protein